MCDRVVDRRDGRGSEEGKGGLYERRRRRSERSSARLEALPSDRPETPHQTTFLFYFLSTSSTRQQSLLPLYLCTSLSVRYSPRKDNFVSRPSIHMLHPACLVALKKETSMFLVVAFDGNCATYRQELPDPTSQTDTIKPKRPLQLIPPSQTCPSGNNS